MVAGGRENLGLGISAEQEDPECLREACPAHRLGHQWKVRSLPGTQPLQLAFGAGVPSQLVTAQVWASLVDIRSHFGGPTLGSVSCSLPPALPYMGALPQPK